MSVKTIFKTLIGTIVLMVVTSMIIELFNVNITGVQIRQMTKMAANQACILFTQETYKTDGTQGSVNMANIIAQDGGTYIYGNFYPSNNAEIVWNTIYGSTNFQNFCNSTGMYSDTRVPSGHSNMLDTYPDLQLLQVAVTQGNNISIPAVPSWDASDNDSSVIAYNNALKALGYWQTMYTTVNLGIPYLDDEIVNKMFRWNLAQILSNCTSDSIQKDEDGNYFVNFKGFRCYASEAKITSYTYKTYDLTKSADAIEFNQVTGMSKSAVNSQIQGLGTVSGANSKAENNFVTVVGIEYQIPISYVGITPIKKIFNYTWNQEVKGINDTTPGYATKSWSAEGLSDLGTGTANGIDYLKAGGINASNASGQIPASGELTYTLIR